MKTKENPYRQQGRSPSEMVVFSVAGNTSISRSSSCMLFPRSLSGHLARTSTYISLCHVVAIPSFPIFYGRCTFLFDHLRKCLFVYNFVPSVVIRCGNIRIGHVVYHFRDQWIKQRPRTYSRVKICQKWPFRNLRVKRRHEHMMITT